ncbi:TetR/AcrR family transcriptional regulator [Arthrobacter sp. NA-172]|uniref:TetR/AcrR family transcriptional regulator n=1 Tax=Arthrobacter sp. NA-172 TaxID=3367524 RepID=UPI003754D974
MVNGSKENARRRYDSSVRRARAEESRERVLSEAWRLFRERGYGATTISAVAAGGGVSAESVYKVFGNKAGLLRALHNRALEGAGPVPAAQRSDLLQAREEDPKKLISGIGALAAEVAPLVAPVLLLIRQAAATGQADMIALLEETERSRYERMSQVAGTLAERGMLRREVPTEEAADLMWAYTSPGLFEDLVIKRGWETARFGEFVARALSVLLP